MTASTLERPIAERIDDVGDAPARSRVDDRTPDTERVVEKVGVCIQRSPLTAVGVAFGGGVLLGALVALTVRKPTIVIEHVDADRTQKPVSEEW